MFEITILNLRSGKRKRTTEYLIKWKGVDENGDPWDNTWETLESIVSPKLYAEKCRSSMLWMQENLPFEVKRKLQEVHEFDSSSVESFSSSDEDEVL